MRQREKLVARIIGSLMLIGVLGIVWYSFSLIAAAGTAMASIVPKLANTMPVIARAKRMASFRSAIDSSISPLAAGEALNAIYWYGRETPAMESEREPVRRYQAGWVMPADTNQVFGPQVSGWQAAAISQAARGLTKDQRRFLELASAFPAASEFSLAAGARTASTASAMYRVPLPTGTKLWVLPIPEYAKTIQAAADAHQARAALDLADGNVAQAEHRLREVVSVGLLLVDGTMLIENVVGAAIVNRATPVLAAFYDATGRALDARALAATTAGAADASPPVPPAVTLSDTSSPRGMRWELLAVTTALEPCADFRGLFAGPSGAQRQRLTRLRRDLVRWPIDAELFRLIEAGGGFSPESDEPDAPPPPGRFVGRIVDRLIGGPTTGFVAVSAPNPIGRFVGRTMDRLLGGRRFETCATAAHLLTSGEG